MFGYLRPAKEKLTLQQRKIYRDYYCSCCLALKQNYGKAARVFLSYDIGYISLVLFPKTLKLEPCGQCGKKLQDVAACFGQDYWRKIAMYEMLLVRMKIMDNVQDGKRKLANRFLQSIFSICFKKAEREAADYLHYFGAYMEQEKTFKSYKEAESAYVKFMGEILRAIFDAKEENIRLLLMIYRWIFFIDAVDDYDKDMKKGMFSLFRLELPKYGSKAIFATEEAEFLNGLYYKIHCDILKAYSECDFNKQQKVTLDNLIYESIPKVTRIIFDGGKIPHEKLL